MSTTSTIVLSHGAFAESSSWNSVIAALRAQGHVTVAQANPLRGVQQDAEALTSILESIDGPVVLVGHSYGGSVITRAAAGAKNVGALVYVAAFAPDNGESAGELAGMFRGSTLGDKLIGRPHADGTVDLYIDPAKYHQQFAADATPETAALMAATQRPIAEAALSETFPVDVTPAWKSVPSWFIFGDLDFNIPVEAHRFLADRAMAVSTVEIAGASHAVTAAHADQVASIIAEAAGHAG